ncbi:MFS transporter [Rhizobium lusitanum]|uniref:Sugar phosphate permease n=1 Tax=Rhizobium lusitanum TaxID=293958 RepID=A0A7X0ITW9_9HYPH|nr:MFS transporter [Rhizobium lusitanum]MBB6487110.1 sugar phosphate permease [Rhizobium lusitanum]
MEKKAKIIVALWLFQFVNYLDRVAISFAGPFIMADLALDHTAFGLVLSSFGIGYFLAQVPGGMLADRWGARPLLIIAPICWAAFTGATGLMASVAGVMTARLCFGLSEGISNSACYKLIGDHFDPRRRARTISVWLTAFAVGPAVAGPLVGAMIHAYGWRFVFGMLAVPALVAALINASFIPTRTPSQAGPAQHHSSRSFGPALRQPALWVISLAYFAFNIGYWGYLGWMPSYLAGAHHIDVKAFGLLGGIPYACAFIGLLLSGWLAAGPCHRHRPQLLLTCHLATALALYLTYQAETLPMALIGLSGAAFFLYGGLSPFGAIVLDLAPAACRAAYSGVVNTAGQIGGAVAPFAVGFLVDVTGSFAAGFAFMVCGLVVAAACLAVITRMPTASKGEVPPVLPHETGNYARVDTNY